MFKYQVSSIKFQLTNNMNQEYYRSQTQCFKYQVSSIKFQLTNNMNQRYYKSQTQCLSIKYQDQVSTYKQYEQRIL